MLTASFKDCELIVLELALRPDPWHSGDPAQVLVQAEVCDLALFEVDLVVRIVDVHGKQVWQRQARQDQASAPWLPRGRFAWRLSFPELALPPGDYRMLVQLLHQRGGQTQHAEARELAFEVERGEMHALGDHGWFELLELPGGIALEQLAWKNASGASFCQPFAEAPQIISRHLPGDSPLLRGRVLDLGCGEGITSLSLALRWLPELLVGTDAAGRFEQLPAHMAAHGLGEELPSNLRFEVQDSNALDFPDDSFDVVVAWASMEQIAGGYARTLAEVRRVLKPEGLFFVHPGLYYCNDGHGLGAISEEPFFHLTWPREQIRRHLLTTADGSETRTPEQRWLAFTQINPITAARFERDLRVLGFEFFRASLRTQDEVEFSHPALQRHSIVDLSIKDLYLSCYNRKAAA